MSDFVGGVAEQEPDPRTEPVTAELVLQLAQNEHTGRIISVAQLLAIADEHDPVRADLLTTRAENERLRKHSQTHRGEMSGYTVGEVEFVESRLRAAEAQLAAVTTEVTAICEEVHGHGSDTWHGEVNRLRSILARVAAAMEGTTK